MQNHEDDQIHFGLLGFVRDPRLRYRQDLAQNAKAIQALSAQQSRLKSALEKETIPESSTEADESPVGYLRYQVTAEDISRATLSEECKDLLADGDIDRITRAIERLEERQTELKVSIVCEEEAAESDSRKAQDRRSDYGPAIQCWIRMLADNGQIKALLDEV